jgi:serine phosphatase RsbU (regulator of sigma subunit)
MLRRKPTDPPPPPDRLAALEAENRRLARAVEELSVLNDLARSIGAASSPHQIIAKIANRARQAVAAEQAVITIVEEGQDAAHTLIRAIESSAGRQQFHLSQALLGWMFLHKRPLLVTDPASAPELKGIPCEGDVRSLLCVPLMVKSKLIGVLVACNNKEGAFRENDQRLLSIIASQSAQVIENARLAEKEVRLAVVQEQLRLARQIQLGLLPRAAPALPGYDVAGASHPAQEIGGDYYDFIPLAEGRWALALGDVSGKGLPASLLMANLQATLRGQAHYNPGARDCLAWANRLLFRSTDPEKFATCFYAVLDPAAHTLDYANAGHERPLLFGGDDGAAPRRLIRGGLMLGALAEWSYQSETVPLAPGDLVVCYSDGVTDARNADGEEFGEARLIDLVRAARPAPAAVVLERIVAAVQAHVAGAPQFDDLTLVVLRREPPLAARPGAGPGGS